MKLGIPGLILTAIAAFAPAASHAADYMYKFRHVTVGTGEIAGTFTIQTNGTNPPSIPQFFVKAKGAFAKDFTIKSMSCKHCSAVIFQDQTGHKPLFTVISFLQCAHANRCQPDNIVALNLKAAEFNDLEAGAKSVSFTKTGSKYPPPSFACENTCYEGVGLVNLSGGDLALVAASP
jgi:hypothetical protein